MFISHCRGARSTRLPCFSRSLQTPLLCVGCGFPLSRPNAPCAHTQRPPYVVARGWGDTTSEWRDVVRHCHWPRLSPFPTTCTSRRVLLIASILDNTLLRLLPPPHGRRSPLPLALHILALEALCWPSTSRSVPARSSFPKWVILGHISEPRDCTEPRRPFPPRISPSHIALLVGESCWQKHDIELSSLEYDQQLPCLSSAVVATWPATQRRITIPPQPRYAAPILRPKRAVARALAKLPLLHLPSSGIAAHPRPPRAIRTPAVPPPVPNRRRYKNRAKSISGSPPFASAMPRTLNYLSGLNSRQRIHLRSQILVCAFQVRVNIGRRASTSPTPANLPSHSSQHHYYCPYHGDWPIAEKVLPHQPHGPLPALTHCRQTGRSKFEQWTVR